MNFTGFGVKNEKTPLQLMYEQQLEEEHGDEKNRYFNTSIIDQIEIQSLSDQVSDKIEEARKDILEFANSVTSANNLATGFQLIVSEIYNAYASAYNERVEDKIENLELKKEHMSYISSLHDLSEKADALTEGINGSYEKLVDSVINAYTEKGDNESADSLREINESMTEKEREILAKNVEEVFTESSTSIFTKLNDIIEEHEKIQSIKEEQKTSSEELKNELNLLLRQRQ